MEVARCLLLWGYSDNDVEHFRPKARIVDAKTNALKHWYWFLAFNPKNYRFSCTFCNQVRTNPETGISSGKGNAFPLLDANPHAHNEADLINERPMLLDPCKPDDENYLHFKSMVAPFYRLNFKNDAIAKKRVETSTLLFNLDFPSFVEERERLFNKVQVAVLNGDLAFEDNNQMALDFIKNSLITLMAPEAEFSKAAEWYIRLFRDRPWVDELF